MTRRAVWASLAILTFLVAPAVAQNKEQAGEKKVSARLPMYYAQVVDKAQREKIVAILADFNAKIDALEAERDAKVAAVLTPEQLKKIDDLKAAAKAKRSTKKEEAKSETKATAQPATATSPSGSSSKRKKGS